MIMIGKLGNITWYKCPDCGMNNTRAVCDFCG